MKTIELNITETGRNSLKDQPSIFNEFHKSFINIDDLKKFLIDQYGKIPGKKNKIYIDQNNESICVGFLHSFWNQDCSHNSKKWFQTDWIEYFEQNTKRNYFKLI